MTGIRKTESGFVIYGEFKDLNGSDVRVQESSIAGDPHAYILCLNTGAFGVKPQLSEEALIEQSRNGDRYRLGDAVSAHLTVAQARELREALDRFIAHAEDPTYWRNHPEYVATWRSKDDSEEENG